jgi:16S rRNA (cytosine967-C5)-methyltransferase
VFVDAPCSGSGTWRRRPDAKWRLSQEHLAARREDQKNVLRTAAKMVKPGGRIVYVTCSVLPEENCDQIRWFCETHDGFSIKPHANEWQQQLGTEAPVSSVAEGDGLQLTPAVHGTDGFYIAILSRYT